MINPREGTIEEAVLKAISKYEPLSLEEIVCRIGFALSPRTKASVRGAIKRIQERGMIVALPVMYCAAEQTGVKNDLAK